MFIIGAALVEKTRMGLDLYPGYLRGTWRRLLNGFRYP